MKRKATVILLVVAMAAMMMTGPALSAGTRAELEAIVNDYIAACEAKSAMLNSRSENIRRAAVYACVRATFCRNSKAALIDEMIASNVAPKKHTVHHYLNARFNETVDAKELALK